MTRFTLALGVALVATAAPADDKAKPDGTWNLELRVTNGADFAQAKESKYQVKIDGGKWTVVVKGKRQDTDKIVIDASKTPGTIDRTATFREGKKKITEVQLGIYKLDGDTLTVAFGAPDGKRPEKFESAKNSGVSLSVYKRKK